MQAAALIACFFLFFCIYACNVCTYANTGLNVFSVYVCYECLLLKFENIKCIHIYYACIHTQVDMWNDIYRILVQQASESNDIETIDLVGDSPPDLTIVEDRDICLSHLACGQTDVHFCARYITMDLL
jgi:hypothetical protein